MEKLSLSGYKSETPKLAGRIKDSFRRPKTNEPTLVDPIEKGQNSDSPSLTRFADNEAKLKQESDYGLNLLSSGHADGQSPVGTLIFIHGLGGHATRSWSYERNDKYFWPKIWLPTADGLRNVRIMSFGYDTGIWQWRPSLASVSDFARAFLMEIMVSPHFKHDLTPIILVAHSMGGLIAKEAYNMASTPGSEHRETASRISGIVFFATPHRGATSATLLKNILRFTQLTAGPANFVDDLRPQSSLINHINETFRNSCRRLQLVSFYETQETPIGPFSKFIVDKESSTLGLPGEYRAAIAANHCSICWFRNEYEANYLLVARTLSHLVERVRANINPSTPRESPLKSKLRKHFNNIPFPRNKDFLGHDRTVIAAEAELFKGKEQYHAPIIAICGLPGVGKTQIAIELAYRLATHWSVFWVRADTKEILVSEFQKLAELMELQVAAVSAVSAVKQWLKTEAGADWLLVFDNADDISYLSEFLPLGNNGATLLTTRDVRVEGSISTSTIDVGVLSREDAVELLQRRAQIPQTDDMRTLVDLLGELPLAIEQAAAYIRERHVSVKQFTTLFQSRGAGSRILARKVTASRYSHTNSVYGTISVILQKLEGEFELAVRLMKMTSFLDAQDIPTELLSGALGSDLEHSSGLDELDLLDAVEKLESAALVIRKKHKASFWIHVLVQAIILEKMELDGEYQAWLSKALKLVATKFAEARKEGNWIELQPHILKLATLSEGYSFPEDDFDRICNMFYMILWHLRFEGLHLSSRVFAKSLLDRLTKAYGPNGLKTIRYLRFMGSFYYCSGKVVEAEEVLNRALENPQGWGSSDEQTLREVARTMRTLSLVYCRDGQTEENKQRAKDTGERAIELESNLQVSEPLEIALSREALGHACRELGLIDESVTQFSLAAPEYEPVIGMTSMTIKVLHNLGGHHRLQGNLDAAEKELDKALANVDGAFGFMHYTKAKILDSLSEVYYDQGRYPEAIKILQDALLLQRKIWPDQPRHWEPAKTFWNLGVVYRAMGEYDKALEALEQCRLSRETEYGSDHYRACEVLEVVATMCDEHGDHAQADEIWDKLKKLHGDKFCRGNPIHMCPNLSINFSHEEYLLYHSNSECI